MNGSQFPDTQPQTQTQNSTVWDNLESQPIEKVIWGRLYAKNIKLRSLGIGIRTKLLIENSSRTIGILIKLN